LADRLGRLVTVGFTQVKENGMVAMKDLLAMRVEDFELIAHDKYVPVWLGTG
jgi:hypothetical protein